MHVWFKERLHDEGAVHRGKQRACLGRLSNRDNAIDSDLELRRLSAQRGHVGHGCENTEHAGLVHVLPGWSPSPIPLWALYCSPNALTPKVKKVLDFLNEYIGTDKDPRLDSTKASECFINSRLQAQR